MALLRKSTGIYYVRRNGPGDYQLGTHRQALAFLRQSPEKALQEAVQMRAEGLTVEPVDDSGGSLEHNDSETAARKLRMYRGLQTGEFQLFEGTTQSITTVSMTSRVRLRKR